MKEEMIEAEITVSAEAWLKKTKKMPKEKFETLQYLQRQEERSSSDREFILEHLNIRTEDWKPQDVIDINNIHFHNIEDKYFFEKINYQSQNVQQKYNIYKQQKITIDDITEQLRLFINSEREKLDTLEKSIFGKLKDKDL